MNKASPHADIHAVFRRIAEATADPPGVTRVAYGDGERIAFEIAAETAGGFATEAAFDAAGNQFLTLPGRDRSRSILIGSHLDSVPHGGDYDGVAGVLLGLAVQAALAAAGAQPYFDLVTVCLRAEESCWFPHSYIGSKTALGLLEPATLDDVVRSDSGRSLRDHMSGEGFDPDAVAGGAARIPQDRCVAYLEAHIEQAPLLETREAPIGIVTGIRGSARYREIRVRGAYAHSGAMPRELRQDAVEASARLVAATHDMWDRFEARGDDLTVTFGKIGTDPRQHSFSKVAGEVSLCLDLRSESADVLERARAEFAELTEEIADRHRAAIDLGPLSGSEPASMSPVLVSMEKDASCRCDVPAVCLVSGAGHDAATFAHAGVPAAMIFIRNQNGSHNPDEAMRMADFDKAVDVVLAMLERPDQDWLAARAPERSA